jgi:deoxycytidine triphosphate deaminase
MMPIFDVDTLRRHVAGLVHFDTQRADHGLDLTVGTVFHITSAGQLDFGGSEFEPAERSVIAPERASPDDDYGWWTLDAGTYIIRYNEAIDLGAGQRAEVFPLDRLVQAGASHPAFTVHGTQNPMETLLTVGEHGVRLKENCRVSRLVGTGPEDNH